MSSATINTCTLLLFFLLNSFMHCFHLYYILFHCYLANFTFYFIINIYFTSWLLKLYFVSVFLFFLLYQFPFVPARLSYFIQLIKYFFSGIPHKVFSINRLSDINIVARFFLASGKKSVNIWELCICIVTWNSAVWCCYNIVVSNK